MVDFRMPSLGADMEAGTLVEWLVKPGDRVKRGDIIAVVETQKGAIEIEVFDSGQVEEILVPLESEVPVGTPLARIRTEGEAERPIEPAAAQIPVTAPPALGIPVGPAPLPAAAFGEVHIRVSPAARRLAGMSGLDLSAIRGTGPHGSIIRADVERQIKARPAEKKGRIGLDLDAMRAAIAAAMARSKREIPHYYLAHDIDFTTSEDWLTHTNAAREPENRLLLGALTLKAVGVAARRFPAFNGFYRNGGFEAASAAHVGVAIAIRGGGLASPALHDVDALSLDVLMSELRDLVQRTRAGRIRSSEIADATITVSSLGDRGVDALFGIIYPPQVALVGFGKPVKRPWIVEGTVAARSVITATLAADHRVSDGHAGALFLAEIGKLLQEPEKL